MNGTNFFLINFYNSNTESEQLSTFSTLQKLLETLDDYNNKNIVFGGDFNLIFDCKLDASGGSLILKRKSLAKLIEIKETLCLCDIWRIRNPNVKRFTFRQNHVSGFIGQRLDFFLISNILQESIIKTDVLASFCTDHSPILFSLQLKDMPTWGKGFWKFNNSLISNNEYVEKMKNQISETLHICISINLPYAHAWNTVVTSGLVPPVAAWICWISYRSGCAGLLVLHLLLLLNPWLIVEMWPAWVFSIGITLVDVLQNWLNWFHFLFLGGGGGGGSTCYSDGLHDFSVAVPRCYRGVCVDGSFLAQLNSGILCL